MLLTDTGEGMITDFPEPVECERDLEFIGMDML